MPAGLTSGRETFGTHNLNVPSNLPAGSYYLLACSDGANTLPESNETNNCRFGTQKVTVGLSDLAVVSVSVSPALLSPGDNITITDTVRNLSAVPPNAVAHTSYYLSTDLAAGNDVKLREQRRVGNALVAGADSTGTTSSRIENIQALPLGTYYLLACVDVFNQDNSPGFVIESNENNNCVFAQTAITLARPDLVLTALSASPATVPYGGRISVTDTVRNIGPLPATLRYSGSSVPTTITNRYYLSTSPSSGSSFSLGSRQLAPGLAAGASDTGTVLLTVPNTMAVGSYYLRGCTDPGGSSPIGDVHEANEQNNCFVAPGQVVVRNPQAGDVF